jgi:hypothetical protein
MSPMGHDLSRKNAEVKDLGINVKKESGRK